MASHPKTGLRLLVATILALPCVGLAPSGAEADPDAEARLRELVNGERAGANLPELSVDGGLNSGAEGHASSMASAGGLSHRAMSEIQCPGPRAENVGWGPSVEAVHRMFMDDPSHRVHVLGKFDKVGIGVTTVGPNVYVTEVFCLSEAAPAAAPVPVPAPLIPLIPVIPVIPVVKQKPPAPAPGPAAPASRPAAPVEALPPPVVSSGMGTPCQLI